MRLRLLVPVLLVGFVATACSGGASRTAGPTPPAARTAYRPAAPAAAAPVARGSNTAYVFVAGWCGYCTKLKRNTLPDPAVQAELAALNWQEVNPDQPQGRALAQRYGVTGFPTTVIVNPSGGVVKKIVGYNAPGDYVGQLRQGR